MLSVARRRSGLSVTKCAAACDVTERTWRRWESGDAPPCTVIRLIERLLQVEAERLFGPT